MLLTACGSTALVMSLATVAIASIPVMGRDLAASQSELQWVGDSFPLLLAALLLPAGGLLDLHGRKRGMLLGLAVLFGSLVVTVFADSVELVLASRVSSGIGAAFLFPGTLATIIAAMGAEDRVRGANVWAGSCLAGAFFGFVLAAVLSEPLGWQAPFAVVAIAAAVLLVMTMVAVPETYSPQDAHLDPPGSLLSALSMGAIVLCLTEAPVLGWDHPLVFGSAAIGLTCLCAFIIWELRTSRPLLDMRLFRKPLFAAATVAVFILFFGDFFIFFLTNQYMNYALGWGPAKTALMFMPPAAGVAVGILLVRPMLNRYGRRATTTIAILMCATGAALIAATSGTVGYGAIVPGLVVFWVGMGLGMASPTEAILNALPDAKHGVASAVNDLSRELAAAMGIAVAGACFNAGYRGEVGSLLQGYDSSVVGTVRDSPAAALELGSETSRISVDEVRSIVQEGVLAGWRIAFIVLPVLTLIAALFVARRHPSHAEETASARTHPAPQLGGQRLGENGLPLTNRAGRR